MRVELLRVRQLPEGAYDVEAALMKDDEMASESAGGSSQAWMSSSNSGKAIKLCSMREDDALRSSQDGRTLELSRTVASSSPQPRREPGTKC